MSKLILLVFSLAALSAVLVNCEQFENRAKRQVQCDISFSPGSPCPLAIGTAAPKVILQPLNCKSIITSALKSCLPQNTCTGDIQCAAVCLAEQVCKATDTLGRIPLGTLQIAFQSATKCLESCPA